jgi:hypothetical protein
MICDTKKEILSQDYDYEPGIYKVSHLGKDVYVSAMTEGSAISQASKFFMKKDKKLFDESKMTSECLGYIRLKPVFVELHKF